MSNAQLSFFNYQTATTHISPEENDDRHADPRVHRVHVDDRTGFACNSTKLSTIGMKYKTN